jgi:putative DNA primase/helicase
VLREGHLGQVYAQRGIGKTWLLQTLALVSASGGEALGFSSPEPCRVLYVDGEMASEEVQDRFALLGDRLRLPASDRLLVVAADWQERYLPRVDTNEGQAALEPFVARADLIILDNRSCLFDPEGEKDPAAWQPAQNWLLSLRRRGKAVLLAHHSNRQGGARGHSKSEDALNLLVQLSRPDGYSQEHGARFMVTFEKSRGVHGAAIAPFVAALTVDGWRLEGVKGQDHHIALKLRQYLTLADAADERPKSANAAIQKTGVNRNKGLEIWGDMLKRGDIIKDEQGRFHLVANP